MGRGGYQITPDDREDDAIDSVYAGVPTTDQSDDETPVLGGSLDAGGQDFRYDAADDSSYLSSRARLGW